MKRWHIIIGLLLIAITIIAASVDARRIEPVKMYAIADDYTVEGDLWEVYVTVDNDANRDRLNDVSINVLIPELGIWVTTPEFDVTARTVKTKTLAFDMENVPEGTYDIRVVVSSDDLLRVRHRVLTVI